MYIACAFITGYINAKKLPCPARAIAYRPVRT